LLIERVSPAAFAIGFSLLSVVVAHVCALPFLTADPRHDGGRGLFELPALTLLPISLMAFLALLVVVGVRDWLPLHLIENLGSSLGLSVQTFAAFQVTTAIGRFMGDFIRERMGDRTLLIGGGTLGALGLAAGIASQSPAGMFIGLAMLGFAHANVIPVLISIAGKHDPGHEARNVSAVMGLSYGGLIAGPILIGALAEGFGPIAGLSAVAAVSLAITGLAVAARKLRAEYA
jgi:MFS family permease